MGNICGRYDSQDKFDEDRDAQNLMLSHLEEPQSPDESALSVKLILLGAGESGKSTLFKQMKLNYADKSGKKFLNEEKKKVISAFFMSFNSLLKAIKSTYNTLGDGDLDEMMDAIYPPKETNTKLWELKPNVLEFIHDVWDSPSAKEIWKTKHKFQITDSLGYFCNDIDRLADAEYEPTEEDYLRCRISTTGISEQTFQYRDVRMVVVDVGGQRNERKKWIQAFNGVTAVLYVVAVSEFDQKLFEDSNVDRLDEAVAVFHKTLAFRVFRETPVMLFLNKHDLLVEKLERVRTNGENLDDYMPELRLGTNYEGAEEKVLDYIKNKFTTGASNPSRINIHLSTALDNNKFQTVFTAMAHSILFASLNNHTASP